MAQVAASAVKKLCGCNVCVDVAPLTVVRFGGSQLRGVVGNACTSGCCVKAAIVSVATHGFMIRVVIAPHAMGTCGNAAPLSHTPTY